MKTTGITLATIALAASTAAQTPNPIIVQDDLIDGVGRVTDVSRFAISDAGEWLVHVETDHPDETRRDAVVRNGFLTLQQGLPLSSPEGAVLNVFRSINLNAYGDSAWEFGIIDTVNNIETTGLYWNARRIAGVGELLNTAGYAPDAVWLSFTGAVKFNDLNQVLVACTVLDPSIPGTADDALILLEVDALGNVIASRDVFHEGGAAPGQGELIQLPPLASTSFAINGRGDVLSLVRLSGDNAVDRVVYYNDQIVAQESSPSPVPGQTWSSLQGATIDLNDRGDHAIHGTISGATARNEIIVRNGDLIVRERDTLPGIEPFLFEDFGANAPIRIANTRDVFYYAHWTGGTTTDKGLFINDELLVQRNVTTLNERPLFTVNDSEQLFAISPGGRYLMFWGRFENDDAVVALMDLGRVTPLDDCGGTAGTLKREEGFAVTGSTVVLGADDGQAPGVLPFVLIATETAPGYPDCGMPISFGELVIGFGGENPIDVLIGTPWGGDPVEIDLDIPAAPAFIDLVVYAQAIFFDIGGQVPEFRFQLTNAVEIEIGAP